MTRMPWVMMGMYVPFVAPSQTQPKEDVPCVLVAILYKLH